jgi:hypothetical protein
MPAGADKFDDFLHAAFAGGIAEPEYEADAAEPEPVSSELETSILAQTRNESSRLLARRMVAAATSIGWSPEDLVHEAVDQEREARQFLATGGDPRQLSPRALARLLWTAGLRPSAWKALLSQAVASYVVFRRPVQGDVVWGRTTGLTGDERADALLGAEVQRDPERASRVAEEFVEEVVEAWMTMRMRAGGGPLANE